MFFTKLVTLITLALATGILAAPVPEPHWQTDIGVDVDGALNGNPTTVPKDDDPLAMMSKIQATGNGVNMREETLRPPPATKLNIGGFNGLNTPKFKSKPMSPFKSLVGRLDGNILNIH